MNNLSLISVVPYDKFFEKWFQYTQETTTTVFTSYHPKSLAHYAQTIDLLERALHICGSEVSTSQLVSHSGFRQITDPLIKAHTAHIDMNSFLFAVKLFRQSVMDVLGESELKNKARLLFNLGKVFDAMDLIIAEVFYVNGMSLLKNKLYELTNSKNEASSGSKSMLCVLTQTEHHVCELISSGFSTKEIASRMNVVESTVQTHRKNIRRKLSLTEKQNLYSFLKYSDAVAT